MKYKLLTFVFAAVAVASAQCGSERWDVKTLRDSAAAQIHMQPVQITVHGLRVPKDAHVGRSTARLDSEKQVYAVHALLMGFMVEADSDHHLVLADPQHPDETIIAEIPAVGCASSAHAQQFAAAANFVDALHKPGSKFYKLPKPMPVVVQGVFFFDLKHPRPQTGVAPNNAELHPVLSIARDK